MFELKTPTLLLASFMSFLLFACGEESSSDAEPGEESNRPEGCSGKCDGTDAPLFKSDYLADLEILSELFPNEKAPLADIKDAFSLLVDMGGVQFKAPTHLFGTEVAVIPYADEDGVKDADGNIIPRRDSEISKAFAPGVVGIGLKHHRPEYRYFSESSAGSEMKEHLKLQDTHIELVVGVIRDGEPGAITINNPQTYQSGLFGDAKYPMIFLQAAMPDYLDTTQKKAFNDNILNWLMVFAAVSEFPGDYNGGDPLAAHSPEKVLEHAIMGLKAIAGDSEAQAWFKDPAHLIYCAELAYVSHNAGVMFPMTKEFMTQHVSEEVWSRYAQEVEHHNAGEESAFLKLNKNDKIKYVQITLPPADLKPLSDYSAEPAVEAKKMAFVPMTAAHIVEHFMRLTFPRELMGEQIAPMQGAMLAKMKPGLFEQMGLDQAPEDDPARMAVDALFGQIVSAISQPYADYQAFRAVIEPLIAQAAKLTGPRSSDSGVGYYVPPSLYHIIAQGKHPGGLLGVRYIGHGVHWSAVRHVNGGGPAEFCPTALCGPDTICDEEQDLCLPKPTEPEVNPFAESCAPACGGQASYGSCYCDESCQEYEDCCEDYAAHCAAPAE